MSLFRSASIAALGGSLLLAMAGAAQASVVTTNSLNTQADVTAGNNHVDAGNPLTYYTGYIDRQNATDNSTMTSTWSGSFSGQNLSGATQTMNVSGMAKAKSDYGVLKASSAITIDTPFYNAGNPVFTTDGAVLDYAGVPDGFFVEARANFTDILSVAAASPVSMLTFSFHLTGTLSGGTAAFASGIWVENGNNIIESDYLAGNLDKMIAINVPVIDPSAVTLDLTLYSYTHALLDNTYAYSESGSYSASSNFFDTLDLAGITAFDAGSNPVSLTSVTGRSGTNYLVPTTPPGTPVPEAPTLAVFGFALMGFGWLRRRKQS